MNAKVVPWLVTVKEASSLLKVSRGTILGWIKSGDLAAIRSGSGRTSHYRITGIANDRLLPLWETQTGMPTQTSVPIEGLIQQALPLEEQESPELPPASPSLPQNQMANKLSAEGFVYLLRQIGGDHWKIGRAQNPEDRVRVFRLKLPFKVEYEHLIVTNNMAKAEAMLHTLFSSKRIDGEWFHLTALDVSWLKSLNRLDI